VEELGKGSYGVVSKVRIKRFDQNYTSNNFYAIKRMIFKEGFTKETLREFLNFSLVLKLVGEHVVEHYGIWIEKCKIDNSIYVYIAMELCDKTLDDVINEMESDSLINVNDILTPVGYYIASQLFIEILEGIQYLHKHSIIHRDLNPNNILLKRDLRSDRFIKIGDFGLVALHNFAEKSHSEDRGQTKFMAPEVDSGRIYGTKADIYSLGVILSRLFDLDFYGYEIFY
jgi:serine/threonine protein kinase